MKHFLSAIGLVLVGLAVSVASEPGADAKKPPASALKPVGKGWVPLFNGKDLTGWKGLIDPRRRAKLNAEELAKAQKRADENMREHWQVVAGELVFDGKGQNLCTAKDYADFELLVDWKVPKGYGDSGIYLRGSPQVGIGGGATGALQNNKKHPSRPLVRAEHPAGDWNTFYIKMVGERLTVWTNGKLTVDNCVMENYWERDKPIYATGPIELQAHGSKLWFRNIYLREIPRKSTEKQ